MNETAYAALYGAYVLAMAVLLFALARRWQKHLWLDAGWDWEDKHEP